MAEFREKFEIESEAQMTRYLYLDFQDVTESDNFIFVAHIHEFSTTNIHKAAITYGNETFRLLSLRVFANGIDSESEGYVSVLVKSNRVAHFCALCLVGVIDATGEKRFLRSFSFLFEYPSRSYLIKQYIKRETLLEEHLELLPDDCLTLYVSVEIPYNIKNELTTLSKVYKSFITRYSEKGIEHMLSLDTELFEKLKDASSYFQRMSETSMIERISRLMPIPDEEYSTFKKVCYILMGNSCIRVLSIEELCSVYIISEKYYLLVVNKTCREMFIALLRADDDFVKAKLFKEDLQPIYQLAETYNDDLLIKVSKSLSSRKTENTFDIDAVSFLNTEWRVYSDRVICKDRNFLDRAYYFSKRPEKHEDIEYDFYR